MQPEQTAHFIQLYQSWHLKLNELNVRGLILTTPKYLENLLTNIKSSSESEIFSTNSDKVENYLGSECDIITFNTCDNFDPNLFASICGSLVGGGCLVLVVSESDLYQTMNLSKNIMVEINVLSETSEQSQSVICPVLKRLLDFSINNTSTAIFYHHQFYLDKELFNKTPIQIDFTEQQALIAKIKHVSYGHANRPLVITANRGRGKSAALGIASAELSLEKKLTIIVTAAKFSNLECFYTHLEETFITLAQTNTSSINFSQLKNLKLLNGSNIKFVPIDQIIKDKPIANLLIIDEAAAIPVSQLEALNQNYNRLIFSTTTDGYEGNGQGFEIRFKKHLLETKPNSLFTTLEQPIRWSLNDELELSCFRALLLKSKIETIDMVPPTFDLIDYLAFELIEKSSLLENEIDLQSIFSLLVNAHYQTRPTDLKILLTDEKAKVFIVKMKQQIVAVCLIKQEGELTESICNQINDGTKRLKGELLPQTIISNCGLLDAGAKKYFRIMRIAVHPQLQNNGVGSYLLEKLTFFAVENDIDYLGSSFSAMPEVVNFWIKNDYQCIRFGTSKDSSSGNHCLEILKPLNNQSRVMVEFLVNRFNNTFLYKLQSELNDLELPVISTIILKHLTNNNELLNQYEIEELIKFTLGKRSFHSIDALLFKLVQEKRHNLIYTLGWRKKEIWFLIAAVFKQVPMKELALLFNLNGKKESLSLLRELTKKCLDSEPDISES